MVKTRVKTKISKLAKTFFENFSRNFSDRKLSEKFEKLYFRKKSGKSIFSSPKVFFHEKIMFWDSKNRFFDFFEKFSIFSRFVNFRDLGWFSTDFRDFALLSLHVPHKQAAGCDPRPSPLCCRRNRGRAAPRPQRFITIHSGNLIRTAVIGTIMMLNGL